MMRAVARTVLAVLACALFAAAPASALAQAPPVSPAQAEALGKQAYVYGFPLLEFLRVRTSETSVRCPDHRGDAPVNSFSNAFRFADPTERTVVAPNVDTLYSIAHLDLGRGPVVLSHPAMGRRYFVFELLDPYTNVIAYVGTRTTGPGAGRFAISWSKHPGPRVRGARVIRSSYRRVWVIGRTLARGRADQRRAYALMRRYRLSVAGGQRRFRPGCRPGQPTKAKTPTGMQFLDALGRAMRDNPPPGRDRALLGQLAAVGVGPGRSPARAGLAPDVLAALVRGVNEEAAALPTSSKLDALQQATGDHGWVIPSRSIGDYGTDYTYRAEIAVLGLGANTPAEAIYPTALADSSGELLGGARSYRITFARGQLPPARAFWSITLYNGNGFLVANPAHRYAIGSTHPPLVRRADGSVVIAIQHSRPSSRTVNWLPAPAGGFRLSLRLYWPTGAVLRGRWQPPPVVRVG